MDPKYRIAKRISRELKPGEVVNVGIGIPTLVPEFIENDMNVFIQSENGVLGVGPAPLPSNVDSELVNASKLPVTEQKGASYFDSCNSFAIIRGGHLDCAILGALQVDEKGHVANWAIPKSSVLGVGGAMDLMAGARRVIIGLTHNSKLGDAKIVKSLTYPITAERTVDVIVTELAVFKVLDEGLTLVELSSETSLQEVYERTEATFQVAPELKILSY